MKTKFLIGALALPLFIASCNSDELDVIQNEKPLENAEIVGSKLISQGMTISVSKYGEVKSRLNASGWETNDKVGLAWYNAQKYITDDQIEPGDKTKPFAWFDEGVNPSKYTVNPVKQDNTDIYGNHKFVRDESGNFVTEANVYEGFHFAYYPYVRTNKVAQMAVVANPTQTIEYSEDIYKNAFYISAQDMIRESDVTEDGTVEKKFDLKRLVNILNFKLQPSASWTSNELLNKLKVTSVTLTANQAVFTPSVKVWPGYLPSAVYTDGELDKNATVAKMGWSNLAKASKGAIKKDDAVKSIKTVVDLATATLDGVKSYRMFLFPTNAPATEIKGSNLSLVVEIEGGAKFNINYAKTSADNKAKLDIIAAMLNKDGYKTDNKTYTLQEVMDGTVEDVHNGPVSMTFELNESDFDASSAYKNITDREKWNAAVNLANALGQTKNITFTVTGDVEFGDVANDAVNLPTIPEGGSLTIKAEGTKSQIHFLGKVKWPAAVENITWTTDSKILVGEGAALTVTPNGDLNAKVTIEEGGKVIVQNKANFNAASGSTLNNGRIEVVYGSHVKNIESASTGDVAFVVKNTTKAYEINALKNSANASVTTLVIGKDINLNLNLSDVVNDPYGVTQSLDDLSGINVELTGGSITGDFAAGKYNQVKNLKVLSGTTNKITDVKPAVAIYVAKKAALEIATTEEQPLDIRTVNVEVEGTLNVNAETHFNNIINAGTINGNKTVHYVGTFNNANGTAKGVEPCDCISYSALESAVYDAFEYWKNNTSMSPFDEAAVLGKVNDLGTTSDAVVNFYNALKAWYDAKVADGLLNVALPARGSVTELHITLYNSMAGAGKTLVF